MCIIVYVPTGKEAPSAETLEHCWEQNPHNAGYMYVTERGKIRITKLENKAEFVKRFLEDHAKYGHESPFVAHMRWATHGEIDNTNTHPFRLDKNMAFCHNGVVHHCTPKKDDDRSDTRVFRDKILRKLPKGWTHNTGINNLLEKYIGMSKVVVMNRNKDVTIINAAKGEWVDGIWYSNDYYKKKRAKAQVLVRRGVDVEYDGGVVVGYSDEYMKRHNITDDVPRDRTETISDYRRRCDGCGCKTMEHNISTLVFHINDERYHRARLCNKCMQGVYSDTRIRFYVPDDDEGQKGPIVCSNCSSRGTKFEELYEWINCETGILSYRCRDCAWDDMNARGGKTTNKNLLTYGGSSWAFKSRGGMIHWDNIRDFSSDPTFIHKNMKKIYGGG